jgi:phosphohistidine phosphatase
MELYLVRHGIAAERPPDGSDSPERPLTAEGERKMRDGARGMRQLGLAPDLILASPFARARQTAEIVGAALGRAPDIAAALAPGCSLEHALALFDSYSWPRRLMLVSHEPDLSQLIGALTGGSQVVLKKGALAWIDLPHDGTLGGTLLWLLQPRVLRSVKA